MTTKLRVLVVDDELISRETTAEQLVNAGYSAAHAGGAAEGIALLQAGNFDVVMTDLRMPGMDGLALLAQIKDHSPGIEVIIMTAYATVETAVAAMQAGAADYLTKPFRFGELELRLQRIAELRESRAELARLRALLDQTTMRGLVGQSPGMRRVCERIRLFADNSVPVLVTGETGTGKEVVARVLHDASPRSERPLVALACGAIPRELAEAQFFGHEKGAFTGAGQRRRGCFERAHLGTLLLDDIDDLSLELQAKLVRVLQEGTVVRVGGDESIVVDVRVVATTKVDLGEAVSAGAFRDDLYYRLRGLEINLPPLRERGADIMLLAQHFLRSLAAASDTPPKSLELDAAKLLRAHDWPGNVRELRRTIESAVALCQGDAISPSHLPEALMRRSESSPLYTLHLEGLRTVQLADLVHQFETDVIQWAMRSADGMQSQAAEILGMPRSSLYSKITRRAAGTTKNK